MNRERRPREAIERLAFQSGQLDPDLMPLILEVLLDIRDDMSDMADMMAEIDEESATDDDP
jgi:hypothetical protein